MEKFIQISRYLSPDGVTTYYVIEKTKNSSTVLWYGTNKQSAYQVAYRKGRSLSIPLYAVLYEMTKDENGVSQIIPIGNEILEN